MINTSYVRLLEEVDCKYRQSTFFEKEFANVPGLSLADDDALSSVLSQFVHFDEAVGELSVGQEISS